MIELEQYQSLLEPINGLYTNDFVDDESFHQ